MFRPVSHQYVAAHSVRRASPAVGRPDPRPPPNAPAPAPHHAVGAAIGRPPQGRKELHDAKLVKASSFVHAVKAELLVHGTTYLFKNFSTPKQFVEVLKGACRQNADP